MKKEKLEKKDNVVKFPSKRSNLEREIEAIVLLLNLLPLTKASTSKAS